MNKQGEKLLSIWWFFVLGVIAGGIVIGVLIYSTADVSIKDVEAEILSERISACLVDNGYLKENILEKNFDIFNFCNLNQEVFEKNSNFYFNISIYDSGNLIFNLTEGSYSFEKECEIKDVVEGKNLPGCSKKIENAIYLGKEIKLIVLAVSNQKGEKVKVA